MVLVWGSQKVSLVHFCSALGEPLRPFSPFYSTTYPHSARKSELVSPPAQVPGRLLGRQRPSSRMRIDGGALGPLHTPDTGPRLVGAPAHFSKSQYAEGLRHRNVRLSGLGLCSLLVTFVGI